LISFWSSAQAIPIGSLLPIVIPILEASARARAGHYLILP
jgi:hypothetical protein